jgi:hypothetical protein
MMIGLRLTTALVIAAAAWPAGAYATTGGRFAVAPQATPEVALTALQDLRSPDARDAGLVVVTAPQDLRSPDARDAGLATQASPPQDLRSPDARDADRRIATARTESARVAPGRSGPSVSDEFEWGDAGIGAAVALALVCVAGGTLLVVGRRRDRTPTT